ncbi:MAG: hypothetical protein NT027_04665 [Proteobacteria bacterium]|nr:hypothetical protein [Pseudomonadota bacterium]
MLGLRRYRQTQIDLWQGRHEQFAVDLSFTFQTPADLFQKLDSCRTQFLRHASIICKSTDEANLVIDTLNDYLTKNHPADLHAAAVNPRRVTVIAPSSDIYDALQQNLFSRFLDI